MEAFTSVTGVAAPLDRADVDTDQIIPKQFLKRVDRTGYGPFLFHGWRYRDDGSEDPEFVLNRPSYREARVLIAGPNFGCGSSREHAAWALRDFGIRTVIAPSFADLFRSNCFQNGMLPVVLEPDAVSGLLDRIEADPGRTLTVDLEALEVRDGERDEVLARFEVDPFRRRCLLNGWDEIALTLQREERILEYEEATGK